MKIAVVSYSFTGNNEAVANRIAQELEAEHIKITEAKPRTIGTIIADIIFKRIPHVQPIPKSLGEYDWILFFGPIWMGQIATPLRAYLRQIKTFKNRYAFISISGGADGGNPKIENELKSRTGTNPVAFVDLHIADLLPPDSKPGRKDTSVYRINDADIEKLIEAIMENLRGAEPQRGSL